MNWANLFWIPVVHILSLFAFLNFSWLGLIVCLVGLFIMAPIGINVGYHRLLTHKSFHVDPWLRYFLATVGVLSAAGAPLYWSTIHRVHHRFSDTDQDPHDSRKGFWYAHILHLFYLNEHEVGDKSIQKYAPDLLQEPYLVFLNKYWIWIALIPMPILYAIDGMTLVFWGGFLRVALTWNVMWFVNSASHLWGYKNYSIADNTVNCWWVGILAAGEGWHNNHHAYPTSAAHGHRWWEFDFSYLIIRLFEKLGLATKVIRFPSNSPIRIKT